MKTKKTANPQNNQPWYRVTAAADSSSGRAEIYIYDVIVDYAWDENETTAKGFIDDLQALGKNTALDLHINSPGGSVFAGLAIYNAIKRHQAEVIVYIDGLAASIASVVAMAGDEIVMPDNALLMVHNPYSYAGGTAADLRKVAEMLDKATASIISIYQEQTGMESGQLAEIMDAETWLTAAEALEQGFIDTVETALPLAALADKLQAFDLTRYQNPPLAVARPANNPATPPTQPKTPKPEPTKGELLMDANTLKADHQATYNEIFAAGQAAGRTEGHETGLEAGKKIGAQAEAERIAAVEAQLIPGHEALIAELKADGETTGEQAAVKVLAAERALRKDQLHSLKNDQVPPVPVADAGDDAGAGAEGKALVAAMVAGAKPKTRR